jgi:hypothetical protein
VWRSRSRSRSRGVVVAKYFTYLLTNCRHALLADTGQWWPKPGPENIPSQRLAILSDAAWANKVANASIAPEGESVDVADMLLRCN